VITLDAFPGETFEGKISYLGNSASSSTRTFPIEIVIGNADIRIGSGMVARLSIVKRELKDAVVVPEDSLVQTETGKIAFVLNGTRASRRDVKTGASSDNRCVVEAGLNFGDTLIVTGQRDLVDGQEVKVLED
jgi:membrane fusion protein (multidrug efflux system)